MSDFFYKTNINYFLLGFSDTLRVLYYEKNEKCWEAQKKLFAVFFLFAITPVGEVVYFWNFVWAIWVFSFIFDVKGLIFLVCKGSN